MQAGDFVSPSSSRITIAASVVLATAIVIAVALLAEHLGRISVSEVTIQATAIALATFASEDLTCIGTGLAIHEGRLAPIVGTLACLFGIFIGDLGLWLTGRVIGRRVLFWPSVQRRIGSATVHRLAERFHGHAAAVILTARFVPGARLPCYLAAGAIGQPFFVFARWTFVAAIVWTVLLVLSVAAGGGVIVGPLRLALGSTWLVLPCATALLFAGWRIVASLSRRQNRLRWLVRIHRLWQWEFWPTWLFYAPLVPYLAYLSIRYRGPFVWTAANPGIPSGGVVGESKAAILAQLPPANVLAYSLIPAGPPEARIAAAAQAVEERSWQFPLILKPDASQRGAGVKLARGMDDIVAYVAEHPAPFLIQVYHAGPYEAGVFYYRIPGDPRGHIFSITDKHFPEILGDGRSTVAELVWSHPRYRMQADTFLARHAGSADKVLSVGERMRLAVAGNHCQGTKFCDGAHLLTSELERAVDAMARRFEGFFIGRFDVRYSDVAEFTAGRDLAIVELNGVTSESTNIYDPAWSLWRAYQTLCRQWRLLYRIGSLNRRHGTRPTKIRELWQLLFAFYDTRQVNPLAD